jgi:hypothetical protein
LKPTLPDKNHVKDPILDSRELIRAAVDFEIVLERL